MLHKQIKRKKNNPPRPPAGGGGDRNPLINKDKSRFIADKKLLEQKKAKTAKEKPTTEDKNKLKIIVLGGLEEVGRNMTLLEYGNDIIIIDMGLQFPEEDMPGIDYIIPNISYLRGKERNIRGIIITHGHMDHIGGIPHLMPKLGNPPIYTGALSAGLINKRQEDYPNNKKLDIVRIDERSKLRLGGAFQIEFFRVNHNIPDSFAAVVRTPVGIIVHTGDFKFDLNPINDLPADLNRIAKLGAEGVKLLMADSTDAEHEGHQISEKDIGQELEKIFEESTGRIITGTFASILSRIQQLITLSEKYNRKVMCEGRSMRNNLEIAHELGYMKIKQGTIVDNDEAKKLPDSRLTILCTGAQGERGAALARIANGEHKYLHFKKTDSVVFSSSVVPGNERTVQTLKDNIYRQADKVYHYKMMDIHAGGHAKAEDLKLMIKLVSPQYFMPIEGNHYMLKLHGELAKKVGLPAKNVFIADNGQIVEIDKKEARLTNKKVITDYVMVDGLGVGDVSNIVLRDRRMMAADGMIVVIATMEKRNGRLIGNPDLISRGFIYMKENKKLVEDIRSFVKKLIQEKPHGIRLDDNFIKNKIRNEVGEFIYTKTQRRPMVLPVVIEV
ncbi:MAG: ribonuclease J [bacterium]